MIPRQEADLVVEINILRIIFKYIRVGHKLLLFIKTHGSKVGEEKIFF